MWKSLKAYIGIAIMYKYFNPNPCGKNVSDCTVRAICKATGKDWGEVYLRLCMQGYLDGDLPNANACWGAYLRGSHYVRGHYSRADGAEHLRTQLNDMMRETDDERVREALRRAVSLMEN